jgi:hypothetical protein
LAILSSCNLLGEPDSPTQTTGKNLVGTAAAMTLQAKPTQTEMATITPTNAMPTVTTSPMPTPMPPNTPVWSAYNYTCELVVGGSNMTMNLAWSDRSNNEDGYNIYRDKQVIATLAPNSTSYVDIAFLATGKTLSYSVEAFNNDWQASSSTITYGCQ